MSENKSVSVQVGPGFAGTLTIIFIVLKVLDKIDWSWWWVFSPLWIGFAIWLFLAVLIVILGVIVSPGPRR
jgi:hypothetical protein